MVAYELSFRVMGANLDPDSISKLIAIKPTEAHKKGRPETAVVAGRPIPLR